MLDVVVTLSIVTFYSLDLSLDIYIAYDCETTVTFTIQAVIFVIIIVKGALNAKCANGAVLIYKRRILSKIYTYE